MCCHLTGSSMLYEFHGRIMIISKELKEIVQNIFKTFNTGKTHVISPASEMGHYFF